MTKSTLNSIWSRASKRVGLDEKASSVEGSPPPMKPASIASAGHSGADSIKMNSPEKQSGTSSSGNRDPDSDVGTSSGDCRKQTYVVMNGGDGGLKAQSASLAGTLQKPRPDTGALKTRKRLTIERRAELEAVFASNPSPDKAIRLVLAEKLGVSAEQVATWFANQRSKARKVDCGPKGPPSSEDARLAAASASQPSQPGAAVEPTEVNIGCMDVGDERQRLPLPADDTSRQALLVHLGCEMDAMCSFYADAASGVETDAVLLRNVELDCAGQSRDSTQRCKAAIMLEGSPLPFSTLVQQIHAKLLAGGAIITLANVKSLVLQIGERVSHGPRDAASEDADVLEDTSDACLWRWEVRDAKLLPELLRDAVLDRRYCCKQIGSRLTFLSAFRRALSDAPEDRVADNADIRAAYDKLARVEDLEKIKADVETRRRIREAKMAVKQEKDASKDAGKAAREAERQAKKLEKEAEKERLRQEKEREKAEKEKERALKEAEKEQERANREAEKERLRAEKETHRQEREAKKLQEAAEREQKLHEEQARQQRKREVLRRSANFMDRFLVRQVPANGSQEALAGGRNAEQTRSHSLSPTPAGRSSGGGGRLFLPPSPKATVSGRRQAATEVIDEELKTGGGVETTELLRQHKDRWVTAQEFTCNRPIACWRVRRHPAKSLFPQAARLLAIDSDVVRASGTPTSCTGSSRRVATDLGEPTDLPSPVVIDVEGADPPELIEEYAVGQKRCASPAEDAFPAKRFKLLQFHDNTRPAYYGTFSKRSSSVSGRHPLARDPNLDYELESDEEWEEDEGGESLSSSDKDDDEEEDAETRGPDPADDDEDDGFVVPDGYLSADEVADMDDDSPRGSPAPLPSDTAGGEPVTPANVLQPCSTAGERAVERARRRLDAATEAALRMHQPLIISALLRVPRDGDGAAHEREGPERRAAREGQEMGEEAVPVIEFAGNASLLQALQVELLVAEPLTEPRPVADAEENGGGRAEGPEAGAPQKDQLGRGRPPAKPFPEEMLPELVDFLLKSAHKMAKNVELLADKVPGVSKKQLEAKIREIAELKEGRWQVRGEVLEALGMQQPIEPQATSAITSSPVGAKKPTRLSMMDIKKFFSKKRGAGLKLAVSSQNGSGEDDIISPCNDYQSKGGGTVDGSHKGIAATACKEMEGNEDHDVRDGCEGLGVVPTSQAQE